MKTGLKIASIVALGMAGLMPITAHAQPKTGDWELTLGAGGGADNDFDGGSFTLAGSAGYFFTDNWELSLRQGLGYATPGDTWRGNTRAAVDFNFQLGKFVPFLGANVGYVYGTRFNDTGEAAPEAGFKWYVAEKTFLYGMGEYQFFFDRGDRVFNNFDRGQWVFSLGVGFNL